MVLSGDQFFQNQRRIADRGGMMQKIAKQLHRPTGAMTVSNSAATPGGSCTCVWRPEAFSKSLQNSIPTGLLLHLAGSRLSLRDP